MPELCVMVTSRVKVGVEAATELRMELNAGAETVCTAADEPERVAPQLTAPLRSRQMSATPRPRLTPAAVVARTTEPPTRGDPLLLPGMRVAPTFAAL